VQAETHAFIIRLWHEDVDEAGKIQVLRGTIEYVGHEDMQHITNLKDAFLIIVDRLGLTATPSDLYNENGH